MTTRRRLALVPLTSLTGKLGEPLITLPGDRDANTCSQLAAVPTTTGRSG